MTYTLVLSDNALEDIKALKSTGNRALIIKLNTLLEELVDHPYTGTGKPEQLKNNLTGLWSRRINKRHRLVYSINNDLVIVYVLSAKGHY
ncbi:MAG: Txe/YoeB family addiction module toxin [Bacteroidetes bacterium HGW-Bacteroidetes-8]|jgi:toxin YoeB|nr:MAG: Txe/YoeB family addiction module toxin [Bacteroidetes bacterium HGW-Bacteroidetes-8]